MVHEHHRLAAARALKNRLNQIRRSAVALQDVANDVGRPLADAESPAVAAENEGIAPLQRDERLERDCRYRVSQRDQTKDDANRAGQLDHAILLICS